jgi:hypothetical protein
MITESVRFMPGLALIFAFGLSAPMAAQPVTPKLKLDAELVLTPEFCSAELKSGNGFSTVKDRYQIGEKLCPLLEAELPSLFTSLRRSEGVPAPNATSAGVILVPKMGDIGATRGNKRELVVVVEWTALDRTGKTLWVQTIEATVQGKAGSAYTHGKHLKAMTVEAANAVLAKSEDAIRSAPQLIKLAGQ